MFMVFQYSEDRGNQVTLGTFIATFLYDMGVLRTICSARENGTGSAAFMPQLALLGAVAPMLASTAVLIFLYISFPLASILTPPSNVTDSLVGDLGA